MARPTNFADPDFEPTDEELQQLSHEAFAGVAAQRQAADLQLREEIAVLRRETLAKFRLRFERIQRARESVTR